MANIKISFNGTKYAVDESNVAHAIDGLKTHLSTNMNGSGSTINFGGTSYNIDSTKLSTFTNDFASYLATIAGDGFKVVVNGVEYAVDITKMNDAISGLGVMFNEIGTQVEEEAIPGLYETGSNYTVLLKSWDELVSDGYIVVENGTVYRGSVVTGLPKKNEYGFYYGVQYVADSYGYVYNEDGSIDCYYNGSLNGNMPAGSAVYGPSSITVDEWGSVFSVSADGKKLTDSYGSMAIPGTPAELCGDLLFSKDDAVTSIPDYGFAGCESLTGVRFSDSIVEIGAYAFNSCNNLKTVVISESIIDIRYYAFSQCSNISNVVYMGLRPQFISSVTLGYRWNDETSIDMIHCSDGDMYLGSIGSPNNLVLSDDAILSFEPVKGAIKYEIQVGNNEPFYTTATTIDLSDKIFTGDNECGTIYIMAISEEYAFYDSYNYSIEYDYDFIGGLYDENNVRIATWHTLVNVYGLNVSNKYTSSSYASESSSIYYILANHPELSAATKIVVSDHVGSIGAYAFYRSTLKDVVIADNVSYIYDDAFALSSIESISFGGHSELSHIGSYVFSNCSNLTSINIPSGLMSIGEYTFNACSKLTDVTFAENAVIYMIGENAFRTCSSLSSIELPESINRIEKQAFYGCHNMESITVRATTPPTLGSSVFYTSYGSKFSAIYVPAESVEAYKTASGWSSFTDKIQAIPEN